MNSDRLRIPYTTWNRTVEDFKAAQEAVNAGQPLDADQVAILIWERTGLATGLVALTWDDKIAGLALHDSPVSTTLYRMVSELYDPKSPWMRADREYLLSIVPMMKPDVAFAARDAAGLIDHKHETNSSDAEQILLAETARQNALAAFKRFGRQIEERRLTI